MKRTALARTTALARGPVRLTRRKQLRARRTGETEWPAEVRAEVAARSGGRCEIALGSCTGRASDMHHRRRRREGDHRALNALHCCRGCHSWCHANPKVAREFGWIVSAWADPEAVPVLYRGGLLLLTHPDRKALS